MEPHWNANAGNPEKTDGLGGLKNGHLKTVTTQKVPKAMYNIRRSSRGKGLRLFPRMGLQRIELGPVDGKYTETGFSAG